MNLFTDLPSPGIIQFRMLSKIPKMTTPTTAESDFLNKMDNNNPTNFYNNRPVIDSRLFSPTTSFSGEAKVSPSLTFCPCNMILPLTS